MALTNFTYFQIFYSNDYGRVEIYNGVELRRVEAVNQDLCFGLIIIGIMDFLDNRFLF